MYASVGKTDLCEYAAVALCAPCCSWGDMHPVPNYYPQAPSPEDYREHCIPPRVGKTLKTMMGT